MKSKRLLLMLLMVVFAPWTAQAQQALPFSDGIQINDTRTACLKLQTPATVTINDPGTAYAVPRIVNSNRAYCTPSFSYTGTNYGLYINSFVTVSGEPNINNRATSLTEGGYADYYDSYSASIEAGGTLHFAVSPGGAYNLMGYALWVDWNQNEVFGSDERVAVTSSPIQAAWVDSFIVPSATPEGDYRMRVMLLWNTNPGDPCVSATYGEAEDYKLTVLPGEACPAPTGIHAENINPFTADLMWTSDAGNYQVRYAPHTAESELLQYDNGTLGTTIGFGGSTPFYWATMYPAGSYTGSYLSKVTAYDCNEMTGFVMIYNDGTTAPENLVATMRVAFTGANSFVDFTFDQLVDLDASKNLWIVFYNQSGASYPAAAYADNDNIVNNHWISTDGTTWNDVANLGVSGFGWMIRANIETISINGNINDYTATTCPLTGLTPETTYAAQVRNVCGGIDGESDWATTLFTTPSNCLAPSNLQTNDITHISAALSWTGYHEKYNVRYRTAYYRPEYYFTTFNTAEDRAGWTYNYSIYGLDDPIYGYSGSENYFLEMGWTSTDEQYIISPELPNYPSESYVEFYHRFYQAANTFQVGFSSTTNDIDAFTWNDPINAGNGYTLYSEQLPDGVKYVAFKATASEQAACVFIDDFGIFGTPVEAGEWNNLVKKVSPVTIDGLSVSTEYEWQVQGLNSGCPDGTTDWSESAYFTTENGFIFIADGNWNDGNNWYLGTVPPEGSSVTIQANVIIPAGYNAIVDAITLDGGSITIKDGAQLKYENGNNTIVTVEKFIVGYTGEKDNYYLISSPVGSMNSANVTNLLSGNYDYYSFDANYEGEEWRNYRQQNFNIRNGWGYLYANDNPDGTTLRFTGAILNPGYFYCGGNGSSYLTYDESKPFGTFNLVGNAFPCEGQLYYYGASFDPVTDFYVINGTTLEPSTGTLEPMQGAFIQATAENQLALINMAETRRSANNPMLNMTLTSNDGTTEKARIRFGEGRGLEKLQLNVSSKLYIPQDSKDYAVVYSEENTGEMPVSFKTEKNGIYTLGFNTENVEFSYLHLIDNMTGADVDLLANPSYSFEAKTTDYAQRFRLVFATGSSISSESDSFSFVNEVGNLCIFGIEGEATVQVVDMMGHVLSSETFSGSYEKSINAAPGVYMIRLITGNDVKVQKIVVR